MSKPSESTSTLRWATAPLVPGDVVEPDVTHKDEGWQEAEEPPHSFFNYVQRTAYKWLAYLETLEAEALTWTADHIFQAAATFNGDALFTAPVNMTAGLTLTNSSGPALTATATGANPALQGTSSLAAGSYGVSGIGDNASTGRGGVVGRGGTGTATGGVGVTGAGGDGNGSGTSGGSGALGVGGKSGSTGSGHGGDGGRFLGGDVNGATNTSGSAGIGVDAIGGTITSDANGRKGGVGLVASGGSGQNGLGHAIDATGQVHIEQGGLDLLTGDITLTAGNLNITSGSILQSSSPGNVFGSTQIDGNLNVVGTSSFTGAATFNGGIVVPAVTNASLTNSWVDVDAATWRPAGYRQFADGTCELHGFIKDGIAPQVFTTALPISMRPTKAIILAAVCPDGTHPDMGYVTINTTGVIEVVLGTHESHAQVSLEGLRWRP